MCVYKYVCVGVRCTNVRCIFMSSIDMYINDVGMRFMNYFINLLPASLLYISILLACMNTNCVSATPLPLNPKHQVLNPKPETRNPNP
jgi:aspartate carbamoyltransferase regulatory subunit